MHQNYAWCMQLTHTNKLWNGSGCFAKTNHTSETRPKTTESYWRPQLELPRSVIGMSKNEVWKISCAYAFCAHYATLIALFMPGSVHSDSLGQYNCASKVSVALSWGVSVLTSTSIKSECCLVLRSECVDWPASKVNAALSWGASVLIVTSGACGVSQQKNWLRANRTWMRQTLGNKQGSVSKLAIRRLLRT